jgi:hypothetical protein
VGFDGKMQERSSAAFLLVPEDMFGMLKETLFVCQQCLKLAKVGALDGVPQASPNLCYSLLATSGRLGDAGISVLGLCKFLAFDSGKALPE